MAVLGSGCFMAWRLVLRWYVSFMPLFVRSVRGFVCLLLLSVILSLSGGCRLCVCCVRRFTFFNISVLIVAFCHWLLSFARLDGLFYVICLSLPLNVVSWRFAFLHFRIKNWIFSRLDVFIDDDFFSFF